MPLISAFYGVLIFGAGIYELISPPEHTVAMSEYHAGIWWGAILVGFNALLWVFLPFYIRNGFYTMPEFLNRRFGPVARTAYGGLIVLIRGLL